MKRLLIAILAAVGMALSAFAEVSDYMWWDNNMYGRSFSASDMELEYHGDWWRVPILLVANGAEGGPLLAQADSDSYYVVPSCPFTRDGYEFMGWKAFDACEAPSIDTDTIRSCILPSGESYGWYSCGYVGERLPREYIYKPCGVMVLVAQWRETAVSPKYRLIVSVDPSHKGGSVSGSGTYAPGATVTLKATPKKGYYFSDWVFLGTCDLAVNDWEVIDYDTGGYQKPTLKIKMPKGVTKIAARFIKASADKIWFDGYLDCYVEEAGDEFPFQIVSGTLLKSVTAKDVPKGVSFKKEFYGGYYFKVTNPSLLAPGKTYAVTVTVTNASGKKRSAKVRIHGPNRTTAVDKGVLDLDTYYDGYSGGYCLRVGTKFSWADLGISADDGWKITKVTGLPPGLKWNVDKQKMTGVPSKKGAYTVMFTVTRGKTSYTASATFKVLALPAAAAGTFTGFATSTYDFLPAWGAPADGEPVPYYANKTNAQLDSVSKSATITVSSTGKISAKVGGVSFAGTGLTFVSNGIYRASLKRSQKITTGSFKGCTQSWQCEFEIDAAAAWDTMQLRGVYWQLGNNCVASMGGPMFLVAQRNPFGKNSKKKYVNASAGKIATKLSKYGTMKTACFVVGTGVYDLAGPACGAYSDGRKFPLSFKVDTAGRVSVAGKVGSLAVSGSTTLKIARSAWSMSPWSPYEYVGYDEVTGDALYEDTGRKAYQADFCLTASKKAVRIHIEFSPDTVGCRHGWATIGNHSWDEYYDYNDEDW